MSRTRSGHEYISPDVRSQPGFPAFRINAAARRLQWNENPFDFPAELKEEVLQRLAKTTWSRYPISFRALDLMDAVAHAYGLSSDMVVIGNGSSDILRIVISAVLQPGDHMVVPTPTFGSYRRHARLLGATAHEIARPPDGRGTRGRARPGTRLRPAGGRNPRRRRPPCGQVDRRVCAQ